MLGDNPWWKVLSGGQNNMWSSLLSGLGGGISSGLTGGIFGKLFGGKKEKPLTGFQEGQRQKDYFQALYGGRLNPWEWAGSGGFGVGGTSAPIAKGIQDRNTQKDQLNQMLALESAKISKDITVAGIQAQAQKYSADKASGDFTPGNPNSVANYKMLQEKFTSRMLAVDQNIKVKLAKHLMIRTKAEIRKNTAVDKYSAEMHKLGPDSKNTLTYQLEKQFKLLEKQLSSATSKANMDKILEKYFEIAQQLGLGEQLGTIFRDVVGGIGIGQIGNAFRNRGPDGSFFGNISSSPVLNSPAFKNEKNFYWPKNQSWQKAPPIREKRRRR